MATSAISVCSNALILLGAKPIASFDEATDRATVCRIAYPGLRDALISKYDWRFLSDKRELTRDSIAPVGEWAYSYVIPGDALSGAPRAIFDGPGRRMGSHEYEIFGRRLFTDLARVQADLVVRKLEADWPEYFRQMVVYATAAEIALAITDQQSVADGWSIRAYGTPGEAGLGGAFGDAMARDAQSSGNVGVYANDFLDVRSGAWGGAVDFRWPGNG